MPLKSLNIQVTETPTASKTDGPKIVQRTGAQIAKFNSLKAEIARLSAEAEVIETQLKKDGSDAIVALNVKNQDNPISSVKLVDSTGAKVLISFKDAYSDIDPEVVDAAIKAINATRPATRQIDINTLAQTIATISINQDIFFDAKSNFRTDVFIAIRQALQRAQDSLVEREKLAPDVKVFAETSKARPRSNFHQIRWALGESANQALRRVVKNVVAIKTIVE